MPDIARDSFALIAQQLERATSVAQLGQAALRIDSLVPLLRGRGESVEHIARQVCELNARVFAHLWSLQAPADLVAASCLVVMGSEGRCEQLLKTDQDNALLLRDGADFPGLGATAQQFITALTDFGYPRCPGDIMLSNPLWRQSVGDFRHCLREWMFGGDPQGPLRLAIFLDAVAVAGDAGLLQQALQFVQTHAMDNDAFFARFARAADQFNEPSGWWRRLAWGSAHEEPALDLKKLGTFPIVHGVRALALQHHLADVATTARLRGLVEGQHLPAQTAAQLADALHVLMELKLENHLRQRARGEALSNLLRVSALAVPQHEALRAALEVVKRFRQYLRVHFNLDAL